MVAGRRFWKKRFKSTPERNAILLRLMLTQLFGHERIKTTLAKAKWVQHKADEVIAWGKMNTPESRGRIAELVNVKEKTIPKITGLLANRYANYSGRCTRIVRAGHNPSGSDRAPLAYLELVANPGDIRFTQAAYQMDLQLERLNNVRNILYVTKSLNLIDPITNKPTELKQYILNPSLDIKTKLRNKAKEWTILKDINRMQKSTSLYQKARDDDRKFYLAMRKFRIEKYKPIISLKQNMVYKDLAVKGVLTKEIKSIVEEENRFRVDKNNKVHLVLTPTERILEGLDVINPINAPKNKPGAGNLTEQHKKKIIHHFFVQLACLRFRNRLRTKELKLK